VVDVSIDEMIELWFQVDASGMGGMAMKPFLRRK